MTQDDRALVYLSLGHPAVWRVGAHELEPVPLHSIPEWRLVNPLAYEGLSPRSDNEYRVPSRLVGLRDSFAYVRTPLIVFAIDDFHSLGSLAPQDAEDKLKYVFEEGFPNIYGSLVGKLRYVTKQAGLQAALPFEGSYGFVKGWPGPIEPTHPEEKEGFGHISHISRYEMETAITFEAILEADKYPSTDDIPAEYPWDDEVRE